MGNEITLDYFQSVDRSVNIVFFHQKLLTLIKIYMKYTAYACDTTNTKEFWCNKSMRYAEASQINLELFKRCRASFENISLSFSKIGDWSKDQETLSLSISQSNRSPRYCDEIHLAEVKFSTFLPVSVTMDLYVITWDMSPYIDHGYKN